MQPDDDKYVRLSRGRQEASLSKQDDVHVSLLEVVFSELEFQCISLGGFN